MKTSATIAWLSAAALTLSACGGGKTDGAAKSTAPGADAPSAAAIDLPNAAQTSVHLARAAELNSAELQRAAQEAPAGAEARLAMAKAITTGQVTVYRFYNRQTGAHFYTPSVLERDRIQSTLPQFQYEGPAFLASGAAGPGLSPVHRFYNRQTGVHFYTISEDERAALVANLPQFNYEGVTYYASRTAGTSLAPLYRFYMGSKGFHFYTSSAEERDNIIATLPQYRFEGIGYYVLGLNSGNLNLPHSGVGASQCYQAGSDALVACSTSGANALNRQQDGHRSGVSPLTYGEVPNPAGGTFARTDCVRDDITGLIWEGKTASGARAGSNTYTNYDASTLPQRFDGSQYVNPSVAEINAASNTVGYVNYVNSIALCGFSDWRLPTIDELQSLVNYGLGFPGPTISNAWFPHTPIVSYWSSSAYAGPNQDAWFVYFYDGYLDRAYRNQTNAVRLVRGGR